jgi:hypothetical protein
MLLGVPIGGAIRDRIWWQRLIRVMVARPGIGPLLADAAVLAVGMALGLAVMRLIAGPAGKDPLPGPGKPYPCPRITPGIFELFFFPCAKAR